MNLKEEWIEKALDSLNGAGRAGLDPVIEAKILNRTGSPPGKVRMIRYSLVLKVAAAILLLVSLNIISVMYLQNSRRSSEHPVSYIASEYFSYIDAYNL